MNDLAVAGGLVNVHNDELDIVHQIGMVFKNIRGICLFANGMNSSITQEAFVREAGINISRENKTTTIRMAFGWVADDTKTINIATKMEDGQVVSIMKLVVSAEKVRINKYFDILPDGLVQFNIESKKGVSGHYDMQFLVDLDEIANFKVRVDWKDGQYVFIIDDNELCLRKAFCAPVAADPAN